MQREVLSVYRQLHRACRTVFQNDHEALNAARSKLRSEFCKNKHLMHQEEVEKLLAEAQEAKRFLLQNVVQAELTRDNVYRMRLTKDTALEDNAKMPNLK